MQANPTRGIRTAAVVGLLIAAAYVSALSLRAEQDPQLPAATTRVDAQPLLAHVKQLDDALTYLGHPLSDETKAALDAASKLENSDQVRDAVQAALDPYCLLGVQINPESRVKVTQGAAAATLMEQGWTQFLVKVNNEAGVTARLRAESANALPLHNSPQAAVRDRWMEMRMFEGRPMNANLSGLGLEYRVIQIYSRDAGKRAGTIAFNVGQGTQDIGFRNDVSVVFDCQPSSPVTFEVRDDGGAPTTAAFVIRDAQGREYPSRAKRLAPDFSFHPQVYRADGETVNLPPGQYTIEYSRGPEYVAKRMDVTLDGGPRSLRFDLTRWIDPAEASWWSGDHHIHAAGCAHYTDPTEGVHAADMVRHIIGEDLKVGVNLTWGPCFDYQKQFFTGKLDPVSQYPYLLRYDVEVSGFGSHQSGHLCLLQLTDQIYPGGDSKDHWPTLGLNTLKWAKAQGGVTGPAHSGWGLAVPGTDLPNYNVPPFDGIGANEYVVDVTHKVPGPNGELVNAVDFMSMVDTPYVWEMNMWYHTLNAGYRTRISGETDFPCIYGDRVGMGRSYVKLDGQLDYESWIKGVQNGRCYVSDGLSHLMDYTLNGVEVGLGGSEVKIDQPQTVKVSVNAAALLDEEPIDSIRNADYEQKPYWHVERARVGDSRKVPVEVIVNGVAVAQQEIEADGKQQIVTFDVPIERSSWVAVRVLASSHTNPIWVVVGDQPVRPSKRSVQWCLDSVDQAWSQKQRTYRDNEQEDAKTAYDHARTVYTQLLSESFDDTK